MRVREQPMDADGLVSEIQRYLATVDVFRAEGCEPRWRTGSSVPASRSPAAVGGRRRSASRERGI